MRNEHFSQAYYRRFSGIARLYGEQALSHFNQAHLTIIGIGGVGSWVAEAAARSGIGHLTLIDMDDICVTNTNRQVHTLQRYIGELKAEIMANRIRQINPECQVTVIDDFINADNVSEYLAAQRGAKFNFVIDAIDSVKDKAALLSYCRRNKIKVITIGAAGGQKDPTQIKVADLAKTVHDPLLAKLRERLKTHYALSKDSKGKYAIPCVYSTEQMITPPPTEASCVVADDDAGSPRMDCSSGFGAITTVTATFGFVALAYVLNKLAIAT